MCIGMVGALLANVTAIFLVKIKVDDAVGATCVHGKFLKHHLLVIFLCNKSKFCQNKSIDLSNCMGHMLFFKDAKMVNENDTK